MKLVLLIVGWIVFLLMICAFIYGAFKVVPPAPKPPRKPKHYDIDENVIF